MNAWHMDDDCDRALTALNDAICKYERATGRQYTLILVPHAPDEQIHISQDGIPLQSVGVLRPERILETAIQTRRS